MRAARRWRHLGAVGVATAAVAVALVMWLNLRGEAPVTPDEASAPPPSAEVVARGAYLARAGNCIGCHTTPGGAPLAGGRGVETPFGVVYAPNLTPDARTGLGTWSRSEFWRAMHHGRSKDGRLLYPAFPYPSYTKITRRDADALHAYLRSLPPVAQASRPHELGFPFNTQAALAVWRALYFRAGEFVADPARGEAWNRGRYLVDGLGHCAACHSGRNLLGGTGVNAQFAGGLMPDSSWYAPSLASRHEAGAQALPRSEVVLLLKTGVSPTASVSGPMAEVVFTSTQHLTPHDLDAMAQYLASIPERAPDAPPSAVAAPRVLDRGRAVYAAQCAACHGEDGRGASGLYPALAGNRAVTLAAPHNLVQMVRHGGFSPSTAGNPRPFGMPPFGHVLDADDIAAVTTYVRQSWGNAAPAVSPLEVLRVR